jgi:membrane protein YqaA with SNARE-associated domain
MKKLYLWAREKVHSPYALPIFAFLVAIEGVFFMPVNTLLMVYSIEWPQRSWTYATVALIASVIGGSIAYLVGLLLPYIGAQELLHWLFAPEALATFREHYCAHEVLITFIYSLLPLPYKVVTLSAGFFKLPFLPFVLSIAAGRALRFFSLAWALSRWGGRIQKIVDRHFTLFVSLLVVLLLIMLVVSHWW